MTLISKSTSNCECLALQPLTVVSKDATILFFVLLMTLLARSLMAEVDKYIIIVLTFGLLEFNISLNYLVLLYFQ